MNEKDLDSKNSWRARYIKILERASPYGEWDELMDSLDVEAAADLAEEDFIDASITPNENGTPIWARIQRTTLKGKLFLEDQRRIVQEKTIAGKIQKRSDLILGWLLGLISSLIILYLKPS